MVVGNAVVLITAMVNDDGPALEEEISSYSRANEKRVHDVLRRCRGCE